MAKPTAESWIKNLELKKHPEGGYYKEIYRSSLLFKKESLPGIFSGDRNACTHIYFLLEAGQFSAFHRILSDELWHFYAGDPLVVYEINENGILTKHFLGANLQSNQSLFCMIKAGSWFASETIEGSEYALVGCTVSPGFDFSDFEMAKKEELSQKYPEHISLINRLCI